MNNKAHLRPDDYDSNGDIIPMSMKEEKGDLISREALKKQVKELLDLAVKRVDDTPNNSPCYRMYVAQENERARLIDLIDNVPTVDTYTIEDIQEVRENALILGAKLAQRPKGRMIIKQSSGWEYCSECGKVLEPQDKFCWNCGADMRGNENEPK